MHGNSLMTAGGLRQKDLKYNKHGKIVSKKLSMIAKKENRLQKAGWITKKGIFGAFRMDGGANAINRIRQTKANIIVAQIYEDLIGKINNYFRDYYSRKKTSKPHNKIIIVDFANIDMFIRPTNESIDTILYLTELAIQYPQYYFIVISNRGKQYGETEYNFKSDLNNNAIRNIDNLYIYDVTREPNKEKDDKVIISLFYSLRNQSNNSLEINTNSIYIMSRDFYRWVHDNEHLDKRCLPNIEDIYEIIFYRNSIQFCNTVRRISRQHPINRSAVVNQSMHTISHNISKLKGTLSKLPHKSGTKKGSPKSGSKSGTKKGSPKSGSKSSTKKGASKNRSSKSSGSRK
jgi:hypothetical protein